ncbi:MAG: 30S ribosomal protein S2 [Candidatus Poribacteria bacterium]|nr:30S ribosomal protein S2 [Candidatus Poribacteria bacterium]
MDAKPKESANKESTLNVAMKDLLESGVHFGHQTRGWNPKMARYIFAERNGIYIIDLQKTLRMLHEAYDFIQNMAMEGGSILFVGTKKQSQESIETEAKRAQMFYVNNRWLGGMLTNYQTISNSIDRLKKLEKDQEEGLFDQLPKKEALRLDREKTKLNNVLSGIKDMGRLPSAVIITDTRKEAIAVQEAKKLGIPIVAIIDTNCDPDPVDYPIPGNDDAIRSIKLVCSVLADAIIEGRAATLEGTEELPSDENEEPDSEDEVVEEEQEEDIAAEFEGDPTDATSPSRRRRRSRNVEQSSEEAEEESDKVVVVED